MPCDSLCVNSLRTCNDLFAFSLRESLWGKTRVVVGVWRCLERRHEEAFRKLSHPGGLRSFSPCCHWVSVQHHAPRNSRFRELVDHNRSLAFSGHWTKRRELDSRLAHKLIESSSTWSEQEHIRFWRHKSTSPCTSPCTYHTCQKRVNLFVNLASSIVYIYSSILFTSLAKSSRFICLTATVSCRCWGICLWLRRRHMDWRLPCSLATTWRRRTLFWLLWYQSLTV